MPHLSTFCFSVIFRNGLRVSYPSLHVHEELLQWALRRIQRDVVVNGDGRFLQPLHVDLRAEHLRSEATRSNEKREKKSRATPLAPRHARATHSVRAE
eukprot:1185663-Prorocentrum_minimum.AAC.3